MSNKTFPVIYTLLVLLFTFTLTGATAAAQGLISAEPVEVEPAADGRSLSELKNLGGLEELEINEIATIQRLLRRLGYLNDAEMSRALDNPTIAALLKHFRQVDLKPKVTARKVIHSLFTTAWVKEGWGTGSVAGQDLVVDPKEVRSAQSALNKLGYAPGPTDGIFGPATFSAVEIFQEDDGLKVSGLLTRNTLHGILRRLAMRGKELGSVVRVLNWPDYISPSVLTQFEKETSIKVVHEVFESSDETSELLLAKSSQYDVMVQTDGGMKQLVDDGDALTSLDRDKLPNLRHVDPIVMRYTAVLDPENKHSVPYMWGTVGIGVNQTKVDQIAKGLDFSSLDLFMNPKLAAELSKCGLAFVDEAGDIMPLLIAYLGGDLNNITPEILAKVDQRLSQVGQYINAVPADRIIDDVSKGKYCVAIGYSGDMFLARDNAQTSGVGTISYHVPSSGSLLWFDRLVVPRYARNIDGAYKLINYLMKPKIAAANTNFLQFANPIVPAAPFIEPALLNDPGLYPPTNVMKRLAVLPPLPDSVTDAYKQIWSRLRRE